LFVAGGDDARDLAGSTLALLAALGVGDEDGETASSGLALTTFVSANALAEIAGLAARVDRSPAERRRAVIGIATVHARAATAIAIRGLVMNAADERDRAGASRRVWSLLASSAADATRLAGSFSRHRWMIAARAGASRETGSGSSRSIATSTSSEVRPPKGRRPVVIS
jgi:hypothetical protein